MRQASHSNSATVYFQANVTATVLPGEVCFVEWNVVVQGQWGGCQMTQAEAESLRQQLQGYRQRVKTAEQETVKAQNQVQQVLCS